MSLRRLPVVAPRKSLGTCGVLALSLLSGCSGDSQWASYSGDAGFGEPAPPFDAAAANDASSQDGGLAGDGIALRVFHGLVNLGPAYLCYDPDYVADRYETSADETQPGAEPPRELGLVPDGGALELGSATAYVPLSAMERGAITLHRQLLPTVPEAGTADAAVLGDAGDAGDAEDALDAAPPEGEQPPRCDAPSLAALLPLPTEPAWVDPLRAASDGGLGEAGPSSAVRTYVERASGGDKLSLVGSGLVLDGDGLAALRTQVEQSYLAQEPGDVAGAQAAWRKQLTELEAARGPRFLLARALAPRSLASFALSFSHLIPDVPAASGGAGDGRSGGLHLCMTVAGMENSDPLGPTDSAGFEFRSYARVADNLNPQVTYRFRAFVHADFAQSGDTCATTSLKPVAELQVPATYFQPGGSYTLVAWGALFPDAICTAYRPDSLIRASCAKPVDALRPRLELLEN